MAEPSGDRNLIHLTTEIVAAYVSKNPIGSTGLAALITDIHAALQETNAPAAAPKPEPHTPAVPVKKSITPTHLICLEDGKPFKSLKRHLQTKHDLSPNEYRARWGLPSDYPMVAPNYTAERSELAKKMGLGQQRKAQPAPPPAPPPAPAKRKKAAAAKPPAGRP